jgi:hypothetical protein
MSLCLVQSFPLSISLKNQAQRTAEVSESNTEYDWDAGGRLISGERPVRTISFVFKSTPNMDINVLYSGSNVIL